MQQWEWWALHPRHWGLANKRKVWMMDGPQPWLGHQLVVWPSSSHFNLSVLVQNAELFSLLRNGSRFSVLLSLLLLPEAGRYKLEFVAILDIVGPQPMETPCGTQRFCTSAPFNSDTAGCQCKWRFWGGEILYAFWTQQDTKFRKTKGFPKHHLFV